MTDDTLIGFSLQEVTEKLKLAGIQHRVASLDGQSHMLTMDYVPSRLNLTVKNNIVVGITRG